MKQLIISTLFIFISASALSAESTINNSALEKNKEKIVSRLYQASFGPSERCKKATPESALLFQNQFQRFTKENTKLIKLITESPYFNTAQTQFTDQFNINSNKDSAETIAEECQALAMLLKSLNENPAGKNVIAEYETMLSK